MPFPKCGKWQLFTLAIYISVAGELGSPLEGFLSPYNLNGRRGDHCISAQDKSDMAVAFAFSDPSARTLIRIRITNSFATRIMVGLRAKEKPRASQRGA